MEYLLASSAYTHDTSLLAFGLIKSEYLHPGQNKPFPHTEQAPVLYYLIPGTTL